MAFGKETIALSSKGDFYDKKFSLFEYQHQLGVVLNGICGQEQNYLSLDARGFKVIGLVLRVFQVVKGKLGLTDCANVNIVNSEILKFLYYGATHGYMDEAKVFEHVQKLAAFEKSKRNSWVDKAIHDVAIEIVSAHQKQNDVLPSIRKTILTFHGENEEKLQPNIVVRLFTQRVPRDACQTFGETYLYLVAKLMERVEDVWLSQEKLFVIVDYFLEMLDQKISDRVYQRRLGGLFLKFCRYFFHKISFYPAHVSKFKRVFLGLFRATLANADLCMAKAYALEAIKHFPRDVDVRRCLGLVFLQLMEYQNAAPYLSLLSETYFSNAEMLLTVARGYLAINDKKGAEQAYKRVLVLYKNEKAPPEKHAQAHAELGALFATSRSDIPSAIDHLRIAHTLVPHDVEYKKRLLELYLRDPSHYKEAAALDDAANGPHINYLIKEYEHRKQYQAAISYYEKMRNLWPHNKFVISAHTYFKRGRELEKQGDFQEALVSYIEARQICPDNKKILLAICRTKCKKAENISDLPKRKVVLSSALEDEKIGYIDALVADDTFSDADTFALLASICEEAKRPEKAIQMKQLAIPLYEKKAKDLPPSPEKSALLEAASKLHQELGERYCQKKFLCFNRPDFPKAIEHFELAYRLSPNDATRDRLFQLYQEAGAPYYEKARKLCPDSFGVHVNPLIQEYETKGLFDEAIKYAEAVQVRSPHEQVVLSPTSYIHRAESLESQGDLPGALKDCREALRREPRNMKFQLAVAHVTYKQAQTAKGLEEKEHLLQDVHSMVKTVRENSGEKVEGFSKEVEESLFQARVELGTQCEGSCCFDGALTDKQLDAFVASHQEQAKATVMWFTKALELQPKNAVLHFQIAECLNFFKLDPLKAIQAYEEAVKCDDTNPFYYMRLAEVHLDDTRKSAEFQKKALKEAPEGFGFSYLHWFDERFHAQKIYAINPHSAEKKSGGGLINFLRGILKKK